jgi:hypothetical protein
MPERHTGVSSVYLRAVRFTDGALAQHVYFELHRRLQQAGLFTLSAHHLTDQESVCWYVAVVGEQPPGDLEQQLLDALAVGEPTILPQQWDELLRRHYEEPRRLISLEEWLA